MLVLITIAFLCSVSITLLLVKYGVHHAALYRLDMPQRFHSGHTPRLGGLAIALSAVSAWGLAMGLFELNAPNRAPMHFQTIGIWIVVCVPVFAAGLVDDLTQRLQVRWRFFASSISAVLACWLLGLSVPRLDLPWVDTYWMAIPVLGVCLAFFGITGLPHAMNIIDGYNGLAGMISLMICSALAYVALQHGDRELAGILACVIGATLGFLFWNYPRGLIFAGDGGSYFWGIVIAIASVILVQKHPGVSPWFVMLLLIYPVWETIFSIYRKLVRGQSPGMADSMHFHQLVYKRIVRGVFHDNETRQMLMRNNRTSPYLWAFAGLTVTPAVLFWYSTPLLIFFCVLFIVTYVSAYLMIVRFKVPRWLRPKPKTRP